MPFLGCIEYAPFMWTSIVAAPLCGLLAAGSGALSSAPEAPRAPGAVLQVEARTSLEKRVERLGRVLASLTKAEPGAPVSISVQRWPESPSGILLDEPGRLGSFDPASRTLIVQDQVAGSADDALFAYVEFELNAALGTPGADWLARGIAYGIVGSCGGFTLTEIESRSRLVEPPEILGGAIGRTRLAAAPSETRLARCLLTECGGDLATAWSMGTDGSEDLHARLRTRWEASLERLPADARLAYPRSLAEGAYIEWVVPEGPRDGEALAAALQRIASAGFAGVMIQIPVHVAAADDEAASPAVTAGADAVRVADALAAHRLGLSVLWAPQFSAPAADAAGATAAGIEAYGRRRGRAVEGLSWLAEQAQVDGLVLFASDELAQPPSASLSPELRAARRSLRRQSLVDSRPFAGDRLAFASDAATWSSASAEDLTADFRGPLAVIRLKLGQGHGAQAPRIKISGRWTVAAVDDPNDLSRLDDAALTALAESR